MGKGGGGEGGERGGGGGGGVGLGAMGICLHRANLRETSKG